MRFSWQPSRRGFLFGAAAGALAAQESAPATADLFEAGVGGYHLYRIPGIIVTRRNSVITYAEARRNTGSDWDDIDLLVRRSSNGGRTFEAPWMVPHVPGSVRNPVALERNIGNAEWRTYNNPVAIAARDGRVHLLFCIEYMRVFYMRSDDDGRTYTAPVEITDAI